ncbi:hypothetical protein BDR04DRAFT_564539 [Suillus decipiens]|nr:hypothetical protein BDR04DRAFT_564539 [Suillus decipiens]
MKNRGGEMAVLTRLLAYTGVFVQRRPPRGVCACVCFYMLLHVVQIVISCCACSVWYMVLSCLAFYLLCIY